MTMKQILKYIFLGMVIGMIAISGQARTINVEVAKIRGDLSMELRRISANATYNDTIFLNFGMGTYTLDGAVDMKCNVVMAGLGVDKSLFVLNKDDKKPLKGSDSYLTIRGTLERPIKVFIRDLSIKLQEHKGIWWEKSGFHAIKIYHADEVDIRNVNSTMSNAFITNFDLRVCSNVNIENCTISNYNNCKSGGNLWLRGEMHNINIHHNKIYKYGNDEAVALFNKTINANKDIMGNISRTNIKITDNEFHYQHNDKLIDGLYNEMIFSVLTSLEDNEHCCDMRGFELARNKFVTNDLCNRVLHFQFKPVDKHKDFVIHDNEFISNKVNSSETFYHMDIDVWDASTQQDIIEVKNNTVINNYAIMNPYNGSGYTFLLVRGGNVLLDGNIITNRITRSPNGQSYGINLLWSGQEGGSATLRNNVCKGLARIATLESGKGIGQFSLSAYNNYFQGRTSIYCKIIDKLNLDFRNNTFDCNHESFFLEDFASKGNVIFNNNKVTVSTGIGKLMTHYGKASTSSMRFEKLEVTGNEFHGVKNQNEMMKHITNVKKRKVKSNAFYSK